MADLKVSKATYSNFTDNVPDIEVDPVGTDGPTGLNETEWQNTKATQWLGYYKKTPELKIAIDMRAVWTLGKGWTSPNSRTTVELESIKGWGQDTFNEILKNMIIARRIYGDAYAEIVRDPETNEVINLKPLDPSTIKIIVDKRGIIKRYEQMSKTAKTTLVTKFQPDQIFHLCNKRVADEVHGVSDIEAVEEIIKALNESFVIQKKVLKQYAKPIRHWKLDTDEQTKINDFVTKVEHITSDTEDLFSPMKTVEMELLAVPANATLNIMPWREHLKAYFFQVCGVPQIIMGSSGEFTESTAKVAFLAFEQSVQSEQKEIEEQMWNQMQIRIKLAFPVSMQNEMLSDTAKDGANNQMGFQQGDLNPAVQT